MSELTHTNGTKMVHVATFNPNIKGYILTYVAFILLITIVGIPLLVIWFLGMGQYISRRYYKHLECQLTDRHLRFKKDTMFKVEKTIPLENIQDITFIQNPILNIFNLKILKIETAGNSGPSSADMQLVGIDNMEDFKEMIMAQRDILKKADSKQIESGDGNSNQQVVELLREIKQVMIEIRNK